jgi:uncharacterized 2Fe-2S/4Fe-4S cluster protein (DUF4445 family)
MSTHRVVFTPSGLAGDIADGTTVLAAARQLGVDLDSVCGGRGVCGRCQVRPSVGSFAKWGIVAVEDALGAWTALERDYRGSRAISDGRRLGCAVTICGDAVIDVPAESQVHRQVVRKELDLPAVDIDPIFTLRYVEVAAAELGGGQAAADLVTVALVDQHGDVIGAISPEVLRRLHEAIRGGTATLALRGGRVVGAWRGFIDAAYGVAVDVGSTTLAAHVCELFSGDVVASAGRMNPQIRFGEDLMSRVSYVMMNPGGDAELTSSVRVAIDELIAELLASAGIDSDRVLDVVVVGNPIMHHLVLGIDPTPLGTAPFTLATSAAVAGSATELDLDLPLASYYAAPCIAGHVGADTAAVVLAERPHRSAGVQLIVDVGTNAEIVLGNGDRLLAASSPTGPAFEGAQISCGQRATAGAVEGVRIDPTSGRVRIKVIGTEQWSDEPGFDEAVAKTGVTGVCGSGIVDLLAEMVAAGILQADGTIRGDGSADVVPDGRTHRYVFWRDERGELSVTQNDVRAVQLAKAALRAGIELLLEHAGNPEITDVRLAGAFGAHIDAEHARALGLVPDVPVELIHSVGNAAGAGAVMALLSQAARAEMESVVRRIEKIETATEPRFQEHFVAAMAIPHGSTTSPAQRKRRRRS